jgi:2-keto-4-pentenoate hydratase/2-oxohepta-3-ene-1,7-dioic acid hydratase in catechol pathway
MRLATVRTPHGGTALHVVHGERSADVGVAARALGIAGLDGLRDVGDLYRRGDAAVAAANNLAGRVESSGVHLVDLDLRLAPPVTAPTKVICVGQNYAAHARESGLPVPSRPVLFAKYPNTLVGHGDGVVLHAITACLDYEVELGVVIGRRARRVSAQDALGVVAGYTVVNDISGRDLQFGDTQWLRGKSLDTWAPMGPVFVSADEVPDPQVLGLRTTVNGELRQDSTTADMIFGVAEIIAFITEAMTLEPGDVIATGTPQGVGMGFRPPRYLAVGDEVVATVDGIGSLRSTIVGAG